jgi:hypothetical protein
VLAGSATVLTAQASTEPVDTVVARADPSDVVSVARAAQARFELRRTRYLPLALNGPGGECDEHVGRFCVWYGEGEWYPTPEAPEIVEMRGDLLALLDSLQPMAPSSDWILGQRVWYRAEAGAWRDALRTARACGRAEPWWCAALEGFALHGSGAYEASSRAFARALERMDEDRRVRWTRLRWPIDGDAREVLERAAEHDTADLLIHRLWALADPLWLVPGNDRLTAHYSRWTVARLRERARNPFRISWGDDLTQLVVRNGWEVGWERSPTRDFTSLDKVIGHKHPQGREYLPRGAALADPGRAGPEELRAGTRRPRSLYAPEYAPVLLPMDGQIAVFPRVGETVVVATHFLPEDTTFHAGHAHALPWLDPGDQAGDPDRIGLFLLPVEDGPGRPSRTIGVDRVGRSDGALSLTVTAGSYVVSAESWSPSRRRAGRLRFGLRVAEAVEDVASLSDLLLLAPGADPPTLEAALDHALPSLRLAPDETFAVAWEVGGLGFRAEDMSFHISVERTGRGTLRRIGEFLGLADRPRPLTLAWEEPAPAEPGPSFHAVDLDLPPLDPGDYEIRLTLRTADRSDVVRTLLVEVTEPR